ncbi:hypothetical protein [Paraflavitalea speifideaquila]|uniref:hypothetical protein n=1 Tax=Paraflavitalea speifideaquila TaxID=3076558 RepID=UPI0028E77BE2|nr:hypothetical protein [Paraflavitalea speifideiaquila]
MDGAFAGGGVGGYVCVVRSRGAYGAALGSLTCCYKAGATPLIWSTGLMSPEAYTLEAGIAGWLNRETPTQIGQRAAIAYDRYQHCGVKAAAKLLVTGW